MGRHNSFKSNEVISNVLAAMFPDSEFAKSFTCGENKTAYLAKYGIASFIKRELDWASRGLFTGVAMVTGLERKHVNSRRDNSPAQSRTVAYSTHFNFLNYNYIIHFYRFVLLLLKKNK